MDRRENDEVGGVNGGGLNIKCLKGWGRGWEGGRVGGGGGLNVNILLFFLVYPKDK